MEKFLYFRSAADESAVIPFRSLHFIEQTANKLTFVFNLFSGAATSNVDDFLTLEVDTTANKEKEAASQVLQTIANSRTSMVVIADDVTGEYASTFITDLNTAVNLDIDASS
jgi:hypothetical protein